MDKQNTIRITVDKSHLFTLGERMYVEAIELIRELVANAYDADASEVHVTVTPETVVVEDDGSGMDKRGLEQFFTIGSEEKRVRSVSPRFGRKRIGQFGIGKFAALAAADEFRIETKRRGFIYAVVFNRNNWSGQSGWELPVTREPATPLHHDGTKVTLTHLRKRFSPTDVERFLRDAIPLQARKFAVYVNGKRLATRFIAGRRLSIKIPTFYGIIEGEIVVAAVPRDIKEPGLECRVRQVLIRRELFGLEREYPREVRRTTGSINADFLPVTTGRDDFIRDSDEFHLFAQVVQERLKAVLQELRKETTRRNLEKVSQELREALDKIREALKLNPELAPSRESLVRRKKRGSGIVAASVGTESQTQEPSPRAVASEGTSKQKDKQEPEQEKREKPLPQVVKKIRLAKLGISVGIVGLGSDGPEVTSESNVIYVNSDHSLYNALMKRHEKYSMHLLRLITQEIVMMKRLRLPAREAFELQSKLLTDAIVEK